MYWFHLLKCDKVKCENVYFARELRHKSGSNKSRLKLKEIE